MKIWPLLMLPWALMAQSNLATDHGTLRITQNGQLLGTEKFDIEAAGDGFRLKGELHVKQPGGGDAVENAVLNLSKDLSVISYTRVQKSPQKGSAQVDFVGGTAHAHYITAKGPADYQFMLEQGVVILDTNFFHHFVMLLQRYDAAKGGAQHIQVFVPQEASPGMVLLERTGKEDGYDKWLVKTDALQIQLWSDEAKRLVKLGVAEAKVEITREKN